MFAASNVAREYASTGTCKIARESGENANSLASRARHARLRVLLKDRGILHPEVDSYKATDDYISEHGALPREKSTEMLLTRKPYCPGNGLATWYWHGYDHNIIYCIDGEGNTDAATAAFYESHGS